MTNLIDNRAAVRKEVEASYFESLQTVNQYVSKLDYLIRLKIDDGLIDGISDAGPNELVRVTEETLKDADQLLKKINVTLVEWQEKWMKEKVKTNNDFHTSIIGEAFLSLVCKLMDDSWAFISSAFYQKHSKNLRDSIKCYLDNNIIVTKEIRQSYKNMTGNEFVEYELFKDSIKKGV